MIIARRIVLVFAPMVKVAEITGTKNYAEGINCRQKNDFLEDPLRSSRKLP
jgi:hypothetical protein